MEGCCLIVKITTGWLLSTITHWDNREHTPSLGFGHYLLTYEVLSIVILLDRTLMERIIDDLKHLSWGHQEGQAQQQDGGS